MSGRYLIVYWIENRKGLESSGVQRCGRSAGWWGSWGAVAGFSPSQPQPESASASPCACIGGSRGGVRDARPPWASKFFRFHAVFGKIWRVHAPPGGFTPPPRENPGSATGLNPIFRMLSCMFFLCSKFSKEAIWLDIILFKKYTRKCLGMKDGDLGVAAISTGWHNNIILAQMKLPVFSLTFPCVAEIFPVLFLCKN